jgi:hypothetical protein
LFFKTTTLRRGAVARACLFSVESSALLVGAGFVSVESSALLVGVTSSCASFLGHLHPRQWCCVVPDRVDVAFRGVLSAGALRVGSFFFGCGFLASGFLFFGFVSFGRACCAGYFWWQVGHFSFVFWHVRHTWEPMCDLSQSHSHFIFGSHLHVGAYFSSLESHPVHLVMGGFPHPQARAGFRMRPQPHSIFSLCRVSQSHISWSLSSFLSAFCRCLSCFSVGGLGLSASLFWFDGWS